MPSLFCTLIRVFAAALWVYCCSPFCFNFFQRMYDVKCEKEGSLPKPIEIDSLPEPNLVVVLPNPNHCKHTKKRYPYICRWYSATVIIGCFQLCNDLKLSLPLF